MIMEQTIHHHDSSVDAVYVDRGRTLILELKAHDVLAECETRYMYMYVLLYVLYSRYFSSAST